MFELKIVTESYINDEMEPVITVAVNRGSYEDFYEARKNAVWILSGISLNMHKRDDTELDYCFMKERPIWSPESHKRRMHIGTVLWRNKTRVEEVKMYITRGKD